MGRDATLPLGTALRPAPAAYAGVRRPGPRLRRAGAQAGVHVEVESERDGADLVRALATRGLSAWVSSGASGTRVELAPSREPLDWLLVDLLPALERWRGDRGRPQLVCMVGGRRLVLDGQAGVLTHDRRLRATARRILEGRPERPSA